MWTCKHTIPGLWMSQTRNSFYLPRKQNFLCTSTSWKERSAALSGNSSLVCAVCTFRSRQATYSRMWHCSDTEFPVGCTQFADFSFRPLAVSQTCNRLSDFLMNFPVKESCSETGLTLSMNLALLSWGQFLLCHIYIFMSSSSVLGSNLDYRIPKMK